MLDLDYGTYPYVTSSSTTIGGVCTGAAVPPSKVETSIGIMKVLDFFDFVIFKTNPYNRLIPQESVRDLSQLN